MQQFQKEILEKVSKYLESSTYKYVNATKWKPRKLNQVKTKWIKPSGNNQVKVNVTIWMQPSQLNVVIASNKI